MGARRCKDWLTTYMQFVDNTESPIQFHLWCAVSTLLGALQRRVWVEWEQTIYPNQYIILVGESGATRKGVALGKARWFFEQLPTLPVERGNRVTKEQLAIDLSQSSTQFTLPDGTVKTQRALTHICPELSVFLGQQDLLLLSWLTDWYDSADFWENRTKTAGIDYIKVM